MNRELSREQVGQLKQLADVVELVELRTLGFKVSLVADVPQSTSTIQVGVNSEIDAKRTADDTFAVRVRFKVTAREESSDTKDFVEFEFDARSVYRVPNGTPEQAVLEVFSKTNAMVHLWPYLRAFVSRSCGELGIPSIILPAFRLRGPGDQATKASK